VNADVATALELVLEENRIPHVDTESRNSDVTTEKERPIRSFIGPFVETMGKASLADGVAFGGTSRSSCGNRSTALSRRRGQSGRTSWGKKKIEAKICLCV